MIEKTMAADYVLINTPDVPCDIPIFERPNHV